MIYPMYIPTWHWISHWWNPFGSAPVVVLLSGHQTFVAKAALTWTLTLDILNYPHVSHIFLPFCYVLPCFAMFCPCFAMFCPCFVSNVSTVSPIKIKAVCTSIPFTATTLCTSLEATLNSKNVLINHHDHDPHDPHDPHHHQQETKQNQNHLELNPTAQTALIPGLPRSAAEPWRLWRWKETTGGSSEVDGFGESLYLSLSMCILLCAYIYVYIYILHTHIHTHIYIHT